MLRNNSRITCLPLSLPQRREKSGIFALTSRALFVSYISGGAATGQSLSGGRAVKSEGEVTPSLTLDEGRRLFFPFA
jgi:hypothetical protein